MELETLTNKRTTNCEYRPVLPKTIFIDMDGVLCNWLKGVCKLFDIDYDQINLYWEENFKGVYKTHRVLSEFTGDDISEGDVRLAVNDEGAKYWSELEPFDYAKDLLHNCFDITPHSYILTAQMSEIDGCAEGKFKWIYNWFEEWGLSDYVRNTVVTKKKFLLSRPNSILIEDNPKNLEEFDNGILIDRPWNTGGLKSDNEIFEKLKDFKNQ